MSELVLVNPRRRKRKATRKRSVKRTVRRKRTTAIGRRRVSRRRTGQRVIRRRRVRRNPRLTVKSVLNNLVIPGTYGAVGSVALDAAMGMVPIPANFKTGPLGTIVKIVGAVVLGNVAGNFLGKQRGEQIALGGVTVQMAQSVRQAVSQFMPGVVLSGSDFAYNPYPSMGEYIGTGGGNLGYMNAGLAVPAGVGEYIPSDGMGEMDYM